MMHCGNCRNIPIALINPESKYFSVRSRVKGPGFFSCPATLVLGKMTALEGEGPEGSIPESTFQGIRSVNREGTCPGGVWVLDGRGGDRD